MTKIKSCKKANSLALVYYKLADRRSKGYAQRRYFAQKGHACPLMTFIFGHEEVVEILKNTGGIRI